MKGIILAGGNGTRLRPLTLIVNKHLLPVYDRPMIEYPIQTLVDVGCTEILIVSGGDNIGGFAEYLGDGSRYNVKFTYRVQNTAGGVAAALGCAEGFIEPSTLFPVILGDNYFAQPVAVNRPSIVVTRVKHPERFGVWHTETNRIIEKPAKSLSSYAVTGLYWYDNRVFDYIRELVPSPRGELEITDINNKVLQADGNVHLYGSFWSDMGTFESLFETAEYIRSKQ